MEYLNEQEFKTLEQTTFEDPKVEVARKWFVCIVYTGMSFDEVQNFSNEMIVSHEEKTLVKVNRHNRPIGISMSPNQVSFLKEFIESNLTKEFKRISQLSEQLKKIKDLQKLKKKVTVKGAQVTFGAVRLVQGYNVERIAIMLGLKFQTVYNYFEDDYHELFEKRALEEFKNTDWQ